MRHCIYYNTVSSEVPPVLYLSTCGRKENVNVANRNNKQLFLLSEVTCQQLWLMCDWFPFVQVFLQHLSPLLSLPTFAALWLTILDFMDKYMHAGSSDLLVRMVT